MGGAVTPSLSPEGNTAILINLFYFVPANDKQAPLYPSLLCQCLYPGQSHMSAPTLQPYNVGSVFMRQVYDIHCAIPRPLPSDHNLNKSNKPASLSLELGGELGAPSLLLTSAQESFKLEQRLNPCLPFINLIE